MNKNTIIVVFSCQKNKDKQNVYREYLKDCNYVIVEGGHSKNKLKNNLLELNVEDSYEMLPKKVFEAYSFLIKKYKNINILKIDDDSYLDINKIQKIKFNFDYGGYIYSDFYNNKKIKFAFGGGYYLSNKALKIFIENYKFHEGLQEDKTVGLTLMPFFDNLVLLNNGYHLDNINISFTCLFETILHPVNIETITQLVTKKIKKIFYIKPKGLILPNPPVSPPCMGDITGI